MPNILHRTCHFRSQFYSRCNLYFSVLPAGDIVEHWVACFGCSCLVKDVEGFQGFEFFFLMDLVPIQRSKVKYMFRCLEALFIIHKFSGILPCHELFKLGTSQVEAGPVGVSHRFMFWWSEVGKQGGHLVKWPSANSLVVSAI